MPVRAEAVLSCVGPKSTRTSKGELSDSCVKAHRMREAGRLRESAIRREAEKALRIGMDAMMEERMYNTYSLLGTVQAITTERIAAAEKERVIHLAHLRDRAQTRLHRAVVLGRRDGLDQGTVARELATMLSERTEN